MNSLTFFIVFVPILSIILLGINLILAPHAPYPEKGSVFECGFHSFLGQNRSQFTISFFIFALLFLLFDLEILLVYPFVVSAKINEKYGLTILIGFFILLVVGFAYELGKNALNIESRQNINSRSSTIITIIPFNFDIYSIYTECFKWTTDLFKYATSLQTQTLEELKDNIMFYLVILLLGVILILLSII